MTGRPGSDRFDGMRVAKSSKLLEGADHMRLVGIAAFECNIRAGQVSIMQQVECPVKLNDPGIKLYGKANHIAECAQYMPGGVAGCFQPFG